MSARNTSSGKSDESPLVLPGVTIVEASAGSGKTYALARRYVQLLLCSREFDESAFRRVLAITFTNKATVEMKERILEVLKKISLDAFTRREEFDEILALSGLNRETARIRSLRIVDLLISQYNSFQVQTIDSFINALLLGSALNLGRSAHFKIQRGYQQYLSYVWDMVIDRSSEDKTVFGLLEEFLHHYLFVENRKGWFPKEDILKLMASFFGIVNKFGYKLKEYKGESGDVIKKKIAIYKKIKALSLITPPGINSNIKRNIENFIERNGEIFDIRSLPRSFRNEEVPMNRNFSAPAGFEKKWRGISRELTGLVELDAAIAYSPYIRLFHLLNEVFQRIAKKEDIIFLEELNQKARELFDENGITVAELYYCLAVRFQHYLIDEFQDTSSIQWSNLYPMIEDALSSGGTLFYVGDKKQAIYRFRGGDLRLFDKLKQELSPFGVTVNSLKKNWRSGKVLVDFFNRVFSRSNLTEFINDSGIADELSRDTGAVEEITGIFDNSFQECSSNTNQGYVRIDKIEEKNRDERDSILKPLIIERLKELSKRFPLEDIAILTRDNTEAELLTSWLLEAGISVESEKTLNVAENHLIKEIISFLGFLNSPIDDLNFAGFILGDIFSSASGIPHASVREFIFSCRKKKSRAENKSLPLYRMFREAYPDIWDACIKEFFQNVGFISLYELVIAAYGRFSVFSRFRNNQAFFMKFLDLIKETEEEYPGANKFLAYLSQAPAEDLYVRVSRSSSVRILTVHKSKGLEFPVVIIPFLRVEINPETGGRKSGSYLECSESPYAGILRITKNHRHYSGFLNQVYSRAFKKACVDELNNLYVALTRAKFELYAFIPKKSGTAANKAGCFIRGETLEEGERRHSSDYYKKSRKEQPLSPIAPPLYKDWILSLYDEISDAVPLNRREEKHAGTVAHFFLSCLGNMKDGDYNLVMNSARENTGNKYPYFEKSRSLEETISRLVEKECLRGFFYVSDGEVYCEQEVIDMNGNSKRIDRLIVKKDEVWVIDYKTSPDAPEAHKEQVREYMEIVKGIYPGRETRGFIIYLTGGHLTPVE